MNHDDLRDVKINNKIYSVSSKSRIFFARLFDIFFSSLPLILVSVIFYFLDKKFSINIYLFPSILIIIGILWLLIYFAFIPWICKNRTFGKLIFGLILYRKDKKIKKWEILFRELWITFIPWLVGVFTNLAAILFFKIDISNISNSNGSATLIMRITSSFYFLWYFFMIIGLYIDKKNQLFFDYYLKIYILKYIKDFKKEKLEVKPEKTNHIHLHNNQPGNISKDALKEIEDLESEI